MRHFLLFVALLLGSGSLFAQTLISGQVLHERRQEPLAFVNVVVPGTKVGVLTDIDGRFRLQVPAGQQVVVFSYLGFEPYRLELNTPGINPTKLVIAMKVKSLALKEVVVKAGENPADLLIKRVTANRKQNNPSNLRSYSYNSYNKFTVLMDTSRINLDDTLKRSKKDTTKMEVDSSRLEIRDMVRKQHFFLTESITEVKKKGGAQNEKILASRISGFQNPIFTLIATQLQSFSFYEDDIAIFSSRYLNPVSPGSTKRYFFHLEDTLYLDKDTVYIISFKPKKNINFQGMKGQLFINTDGYAIQNVIAEPFEQDKGLKVKIQQKYEKVGRQAWFPTQLNTDLNFGEVVRINDSSGYAIGIGRSYLQEIQINPELRRRDVGMNGTEYVDKLAPNESELWNKYRPDTLTLQERQTYVFMDSIGKAQKLDQKVGWLLTLATGRLRWGYADIMLKDLLKVNQWEGIRLGLGLQTNDRLSKRFYVGGSAGWGLNDAIWKYSLEGGLHFDRKKNFSLIYRHASDLFEIGGNQYFNKQLSLIAAENLREIFTRWFDYTKSHRVGFQFLNQRNWSGEVFYENRRHTPFSFNPYTFTNGNGEDVRPADFQEAGIKLRYSFRERYLSTPNATLSLGSKYPVIWVNYLRSLNQAGGDYERVDFRLKDDLPIRHAGTLRYILSAGIANDHSPLQRLYYLPSVSNDEFTLFIPEYFQTAGPNGFVANRFVHVNLNYNFGRFLKKNAWVNPQFGLMFNAGWGELTTPTRHNDFPLPLLDYQKGLFETGVFLHDIMQKTALRGYGFGVVQQMIPGMPARTFFRISISQTL